MKTLGLVLFTLFITSIGVSQDINQFDANGKRHGIWKKYFDNTKILRYEGSFSHGKEIGTFKFYKNIRNKALLSASKIFNDQDNTSKVTFFTSRGKRISEGELDGKVYIGTWKYYQKRSDKLLTLEHYDNSGNLIGDRFVYYPNGQVAEKQFYKAGKLEGASVWYSNSNVVLKEFLYVDGKLHGVTKYYSPKGDLTVEGQYKNDKKHGIWKYYDNGTLIEEKNFTRVGKYKKKTK